MLVCDACIRIPVRHQSPVRHWAWNYSVKGKDHMQTHCTLPPTCPDLSINTRKPVLCLSSNTVRKNTKHSRTATLCKRSLGQGKYHRTAPCLQRRGVPVSYGVERLCITMALRHDNALVTPALWRHATHEQPASQPAASYSNLAIASQSPPLIILLRRHITVVQHQFDQSNRAPPCRSTIRPT